MKGFLVTGSGNTPHALIKVCGELVMNGGTVEAKKFANVRGFNVVSVASAADVSGSVYATWEGITKDVTEIQK